MAEYSKLANSLKEFIIDCQSDSHNAKGVNAHRYNNLKLYANIQKYRVPHFCISIAISEAVYNLQNEEKLAGSMGQDERYIKRWLNRSNVKTELTEAWQSAVKINVIKNDE